MQARIVRYEVLPLVLYMVALVASTLLIDAALHLLNIVWIGRWLGIPGVLLILGSFGYSMRKRKLIRSGNPATLLRWHGWARCWCWCMPAFTSTPSSPGWPWARCSSTSPAA